MRLTLCRRIQVYLITVALKQSELILPSCWVVFKKRNRWKTDLFTPSIRGLKALRLVLKHISQRVELFYPEKSPSLPLFSMAPTVYLVPFSGLSRAFLPQEIKLQEDAYLPIYLVPCPKHEDTPFRSFDYPFLAGEIRYHDGIVRTEQGLCIWIRW